MRFRLTTLLVLIAACAVGLAIYAQFRRSQTAWQRAGGMIGWSQAAIESRLGPATETIEGELPDTEGQTIRPAPVGPCRTLIFRTFDGTFVAWMATADGGSTCFRSMWAEQNTYY
jgi:hypothetical protein